MSPNFTLLLIFALTNTLSVALILYAAFKVYFKFYHKRSRLYRTTFKNNYIHETTTVSIEKAEKRALERTNALGLRFTKEDIDKTEVISKSKSLTLL